MLFFRSIWCFFSLYLLNVISSSSNCIWNCISSFCDTHATHLHISLSDTPTTFCITPNEIDEIIAPFFFFLPLTLTWWQTKSKCYKLLFLCVWFWHWREMIPRERERAMESYRRHSMQIKQANKQHVLE